MSHQYVLSFVDNDEGFTRNFSHSFELPYDATYSDVISYMSDFLSAVYGYRIDLEASVNADFSDSRLSS